MKRMVKKRALVCVLLLLSIFVSVCSLTVAGAEESAKEYYVCFSTESFAVRNANKMKKVGDEYLLERVDIGPGEEFYVTDGSGTKYYAKDGDPMTTGELAEYTYTVRFNPSATYSEENAGYERTDCHVSYSFFVPGEVSLKIGEDETMMSYNSYFTAYDLYYISSVTLPAGTTVTLGEEVHTVENAGEYRILYTPGEQDGDDLYLFDEDGSYGTGEEYKYRLYIEDAPVYFVSFVDPVINESTPDATINGDDAYRLARYEKNVSAEEYRGGGIFIGECDTVLKYRIYELLPTGAYKLIDDDSDEDTTFSGITVSEVGNYEIALIDAGESHSVSTVARTYDHGGYYLLGNMNGWGFTDLGEVDLPDEYRFEKLEETDEDFDEDFDQYKLTFFVTSSHLKEGDFEFIITDGENVYMNLLSHVTIDKTGEYEILFSDEHDYGRGRNYRYTLIDGERDMREITVGTPEEYLALAKECNRSADYSHDLIVYISADIDFGGTEITPIYVFNGIIRGGYHSLIGIKLPEDGDCHALIGTLTRDAQIERLSVKLTFDSSSAEYVGFVGKNYGKIKAVNVSGEITGRSYVGAVAAYNGRTAETTGAAENSYVSGVIEDCSSECTVLGFSNIGGIAGFNNGLILSSQSRGTVGGKVFSANSTPINLGGIAGYSAGRITDSVNRAQVISDSSSLNVGGIAGLCTGDIYYCSNLSPIKGTKYVGGIVGYYGTVTEDENDLESFYGSMSYEDFLGFINDDDSEYEQIDGREHAIFYSVNEATVSARSYAGGIVGYTDYAFPVEGCINKAKIEVTGGSYAGGIAGYGSEILIKGCIGMGSVSVSSTDGGRYAGGIAGYAYSIVGSTANADISGGDYIGGIVGYSVSEIRTCYSNAVLISDSGARNVGDIAGYAQSYNDGFSSFGGSVEYNYYVGTAGGIGRTEFGEKYDMAAKHISPDALRSEGALSSILHSGFSSELWLGGLSGSTYPVARMLIEIAECEEYGDDEEFSEYFEKHKTYLGECAEDSAKVLYIVTFLEWDPDLGDLYDDGKLMTDRFEIIATLRVPEGEAISDRPAFVYAEADEGGRWISKGSDARYLASLALPEGPVSENLSVYATYREIVTTLTDKSGKILVEGIFEKGTELELVATPYGHTAVFSKDGKTIDPLPVKVKYPIGDMKGEIKVTVCTPDGERIAEHTVSGKYVSFDLNPGESFTVAATTGISPILVAVLIAAAGAVLGIIATLIAVKLRSRKRSK